MRKPDQGGTWGIFGGAFDPIHYGHLGLAHDLLKALSYTGILFVPSFNPPRKRDGCVASFEHRAEMLRLAIETEPLFALDLLERESAAPGYTLLTVRALKKRFPQTTFDFIIGADLLTELESWYEADEILREVRIVAGSRPGAIVRIPAKFPAGSIRVVETGLVDIASRDIRRLLAEGMTQNELERRVPIPVAQYIIDRGLYR